MVTNIIYATIVIVIILPFVYIYFWINVNSLRHFTIQARMAVLPIQTHPTVLVTQPPPYGSSFQPNGGGQPPVGSSDFEHSNHPNTMY